MGVDRSNDRQKVHNIIPPPSQSNLSVDAENIPGNLKLDTERPFCRKFCTRSLHCDDFPARSSPSSTINLPRFEPLNAMLISAVFETVSSIFSELYTLEESEVWRWTPTVCTFLDLKHYWIPSLATVYCIPLGRRACVQPLQDQPRQRLFHD